MATQQKSLSLGGKVFFSSLCVSTFSLGVWQTQRYFDKIEKIDERNLELAKDPVSIDKLKPEYDPYHRIRVQGKYLHEKEFLVGPRGPPVASQTSQQGFYVHTPMQTPIGTVIVNRGWIPRNMVLQDARSKYRQSEQSNSKLLDWKRPAREEIIAIQASQEKPKYLVAAHKLDEKPPQLYWFDEATMRDIIEADDVPMVLTALRDEKDTVEYPLRPTKERAGEFKVGPPVHVGYAVTWYGLAAAGVYMTRILLRR